MMDIDVARTIVSLDDQLKFARRILNEVETYEHTFPIKFEHGDFPWYDVRKVLGITKEGELPAIFRNVLEDQLTNCVSQLASELADVQAGVNKR